MLLLLIFYWWLSNGKSSCFFNILIWKSHSWRIRLLFLAVISSILELVNEVLKLLECVVLDLGTFFTSQKLAELLLIIFNNLKFQVCLLTLICLFVVHLLLLIILVFLLILLIVPRKKHISFLLHVTIFDIAVRYRFVSHF